ncbi:MAG: hypothetical protein QF486_06815 [Candidatus Woesearchaeota archaeon]|nr:hypothetical protein [Candidatus Woesearchaeota archaeon]MDP7199297.1 hypothetical protein [Candidatus Woesearchaeota archaeon]MDP7467918.1 hypothetical protein [Candidatus Woesearchaeota archaeon]MDP7647876.1 hypothetical protein [Candidatus Woesearchaeota archaeon]
MSLANTVITSEDSVKGTYHQPHRAKWAVEFLQDHDVFPATYGNPKIQLVTTAGLYAYFDNQIFFHKSQANANWGEHMDPDLEAKLKTHLGWESSKKNPQDNKGSAFYARLLATMGFYVNDQPQTRDKRSTRGKNGSELPRFLSTIIDNYPYLGVVDKKVAKQYMRNLCMAWTRCRRKKEEGAYVVTFLKQPTEDLVLKEASQLRRSMNIVWEMDLQEKHQSIRESRPNVWVGEIRLPIQQMAKVCPYSYPPFSFQVKTKSRYSFDHPTHQFNSSSD